MMMHSMMPKFYYKPEDRLMDCEELCGKYGTELPLHQLGIYALSVQPDYVPVGFRNNGDGTYYPVQSYTEVRDNAIAALVAAGYTQAEAEAIV